MRTYRIRGQYDVDGLQVLNRCAAIAAVVNLEKSKNDLKSRHGD